jgi:hypothetical protein
MMWIDGISPLRVIEAYIAAIAVFFVYSIPAAIQHRHSPIVKDAPRGLHIDWTSLAIVAATRDKLPVPVNSKPLHLIAGFVTPPIWPSPRHCDHWRS